MDIHTHIYIVFVREQYPYCAPLIHSEKQIEQFGTASHSDNTTCTPYNKSIHIIHYIHEYLY